MKYSRYLLVSIVAGALLLGGCVSQNEALQKKPSGNTNVGLFLPPTQESSTLQTQQMETVGALSYSTGDLKVGVTVRKGDPQQTWNAQALQAAADECGTKQDLKHYEDLMAELKGKDMVVYKFTAKDSPEEIFEITILSNAHHYASLQDFRKDFDVCAAGGIYPTMVSPKWLLFTGSCGGAYDKTPPLTCADISKVVTPSLRLSE